MLKAEFTVNVAAALVIVLLAASVTNTLYLFPLSPISNAAVV